MTHTNTNLERTYKVRDNKDQRDRKRDKKREKYTRRNNRRDKFKEWEE